MVWFLQVECGDELVNTTPIGLRKNALTSYNYGPRQPTGIQKRHDVFSIIQQASARSNIKHTTVLDWRLGTVDWETRPDHLVSTTKKSIQDAGI